MIALALQDPVSRPFLDLASKGADIDVIGAWLIAFFTLSVFSFLYKDNPFYKTAEHIFVGAGTAFFTLEYYESGVLGPLYRHLSDSFDARQVAGATVDLGGYPVDPLVAILSRSGAVAFSLMLLWRLVKPGSWAPRWPLAVMVGVYAALKMTGETQSKLVLQVKALMKPLTSDTAIPLAGDWARFEETGLYYTLANLVVLVGAICAMGHFLFTWRRTKLLGGVSRAGIVVLMITFGSMFGFTVLGRIALLIDRVKALDDVTGKGYELAGDHLATDSSQVWLANLTSPPVLSAALIVLVLLLARGRKVQPSAG